MPAEVKPPRRDPGPEIKEALRREVNFGCPIRHPDGTGCGSPILTWHHFAPPWSEGMQHSVEGMIALCKPHHDQADGNLWTKAQLRDFKRNPFVDSRIKVRWPWQTETMLIKVGTSLVLNKGSALRLDGIPVLKFEPAAIPGLDAQTVLATAQIRNASGQRWVDIDAGWMEVELQSTLDTGFSAQTKLFTAKHNDSTFVSMKYVRKSLPEFKKWVAQFWNRGELPSIYKTIEDYGGVDSDGFVPAVELCGRFTTDKVTIDVGQRRMMLTSHVPGMLAKPFPISSTLVDNTRRMILKMHGEDEFFSLG